MDERITLLGQSIDLVRPEEVIHFIQQSVVAGKPALIANHNMHSLYLMKRKKMPVTLYEHADIVEVDSAPLLMWAKLTGRMKVKGFHRCTYLDWRDLFWGVAADSGWRVFYLGSAPGVAVRATEKIARDHPGVTIATHHGYFDMTAGSTENGAVIDSITRFRPHVLMVGMGMPRQEEWIVNNHDDLGCCVVIPVGAAFDYEAGVQQVAPRWVGRIGLEWLFRLVVNPRRLFTRYCLEPWWLLSSFVHDFREARANRRCGSPVERRTGGRPKPRPDRRRASDLRGSVDAESYE